MPSVQPLTASGAALWCATSCRHEPPPVASLCTVVGVITVAMVASGGLDWRGFLLSLAGPTVVLPGAAVI